MEPLLQNQNNKYTTFPIVYKDIWEFYENHEKAVWFAREIDLTTDIKDWRRLNEDEQYFIKHILAFFAASDGIVMENLAARFSNEIQIAEARAFYSIQTFMENVHSITYSLLIDTYIQNKDEKLKLFNAVENIPAVKNKALWAIKWINSEEDFATRLIAFAIVEGVFFSGAFCSIYWIADKGIMKGLCMSNEFIARDENLHTMFAVLLYTKYIVNKIPQEKIHNIFKEAVDIEKEFITDALPCSLIGMNSNMMLEYIEFVADRLIKQLGYAPIWGTTNPFPFMEKIALENYSNFFDTRVSEYQKSTDLSRTIKKDINYDMEF